MTSFDPNNHDHDNQGNCLDSDGNPVAVLQTAPPPEYSLSGYDLIGIGLIGIGNIGGVIATLGMSLGGAIQQTTRLAAAEFFAAANYRRTQRQEDRHRRSIEDDLKSLQAWQDGGS